MRGESWPSRFHRNVSVSCTIEQVYMKLDIFAWPGTTCREITDVSPIFLTKSQPFNTRYIAGWISLDIHIGGRDAR